MRVKESGSRVRTESPYSHRRATPAFIPGFANGYLAFAAMS